MITICLLLSSYVGKRSFTLGFESQPAFGTETVIFPFSLVTWKVFNPSNVGPCYIYPVIIENPALCNGQIILSPINVPLANENPKCAHLLWTEYIFPS
jgi:hypothetical protein